MTESAIQVLNSSLAVVLLPVGALGIDNNVKKLSNRITILSICVFGALVYWSFCAVLTSLLAVSENPLTINTLSDLLEDRPYTLYYVKGTAAYNYFSEATEQTNRNGYNLFREYSNFNEKGIINTFAYLA